jgi:hypothetical protein
MMYFPYAFKQRSQRTQRIGLSVTDFKILAVARKMRKPPTYASDVLRSWSQFVFTVRTCTLSPVAVGLRLARKNAI